MNKAENYEWLSIREHALKRPDTYVGSVQLTDITFDDFESDASGKLCATKKSVTTSPALLKFLDEAIINSLDNYRKDMSQKYIKCSYDDGVFGVENDGNSISTTFWPNTTRHIPEILFGEMLSGENFNDEVKHKHVGGRNGIGGKIIILFSTWAEIEIINLEENCHYTQRWSQNMSVCNPPVLKTPAKKHKHSRFSIRWLPDFARLGVEVPLTKEFESLVRMRAMEVAACTPSSLTVHYNQRKIPIQSVKEYIGIVGGTFLHRDEHRNGDECVFEVCLSVATGESPYIMSFVNGLKVPHGTLIELVIRRFSDRLSEIISKKMKREINVTPHSVREKFNIICNALIPNPSFTSQSKDKLDTRTDRFGFVYTVTPAMCRALERSDACARMISEFTSREEKNVQKSIKTTKRVDIPKYQRATKLGGKSPCCLYLTEGDSAKNLALAGFTVVGREHNGVFPLRGKLINVHGMSPKKAIENAEIKALVQILGLDFSTEYTDENIVKLPYRTLMIFTDQDEDGSHIMGLVLNVFNTFFPSLLTHHFIRRFCTPIVKASFSRVQESFFTLSAFKHACETRSEPPSKFKYYKGLGTSTDAEAKEYFSNLSKHQKDVQFTQACLNTLNLFFAKARVDDRRQLLQTIDASKTIDYSQSSITCTDFCLYDLLHFSRADNVRSIPSVIDGMKPSQRKILHTLFRRGENADEMKVAQLAARAAEKTSYHHGEESLMSTITNMAQDWLGTNNMPFLVPEGQFGSRHNPKPSQPRYIFTRVQKIAWKLFPKEDLPLLEYLHDDGHEIEPRYFVPIIPTVLVNGADGIGTGWRTLTPTFNPIDVINAVRCLICDMSVPDLHPMCVGFKGTIVPEDDGTSYIFHGIHEIKGNTIIITELPPWKATEKYKEWLREHVGHLVIDIIDQSPTCDDVILHVVCKPDSLVGKDIDTLFKLSSKITTTQMVLFDSSGSVKRYTRPIDIIHDHHVLRVQLYTTRIRHLIDEESQNECMARNKVRFIQDIISGSLQPAKFTKGELQNELMRRKFDPSKSNGTKPFEYLLSISIDNMTQDMILKLVADADKSKQQLQLLKKKTVKTEWLHDLDCLEKAYQLYKTARFEQSTVKATKRINDSKLAIGKRSKKIVS